MGMPPMVGMPPMPPVPGMPYMPGFDGLPAAAAADGSNGTSTGAESRTTVMWRNIPNNYSRDQLLELIDNFGFQGTYNFFYAPFDFTRGALVGYAFINFEATCHANH